jgi:hypothetical protein
MPKISQLTYRIRETPTNTMTAFVVLGVSTPLENVHTAKIPAYPPNVNALEYA